MVGKPDRRFLTLPAVNPCHGVSPAALLQALTSLARDIQSCHRSSSFPTHGRSVREAVREVGAVLEFLEELRDRGGADLLPVPAILSLSELHVVFQKLRHLVRDCGSRGARALVLARSGRVSDEFRILVRSVATALEVLPLAAIDVPAEVKDLVRLVAEQARRVAIGTDPADARAESEVLEILGQFEKGVPPDRARLEEVLKHLQIRTWTDSDEEILFLEEELGAALSSNGEPDEIPLLSNLRGLMLYSRSVVFDVLDSRRSSSSSSFGRQLEGGPVLEHLNIEEFRCPISLELMVEPVTISTGHTYDRESILRWLGSGNLTCPVTGKRLGSNELVPNCTLQKLIRHFCQEHNISIRKACNNGRYSFSKSSLPGTCAAARATRMTCDMLVKKLSNFGPADGHKTVYETRLLAKSSMFDEACLVEAGVVPWLLRLLLSLDSQTQEDAMAAVLSLSKHTKGRKSIFKWGGLNPVVEVLKKGLKAEAQQNAAATIFYLSSVDEYRRGIGEIPEAIPALVALLQKGGTRGKKNAVVALFGLLLFRGNHRRVLAAGAVSNLIDQLSSEREDLVGDCLAVLAALAESPEGTHVILQHAAVPSLVSILRSPSSLVRKEYCVSVLLHLCNNGGARVVKFLDSIPCIMPALYLVLAEGSPRAAKKASALLSILHGVQGTPGIPTIPVRREHVGHMR